jgi:hypothetical protein
MKHIKKIAVLLCCLAATAAGFSQEVTFGEVSVADLEQKQDPVFPEQHAVILYRNIDFNYGKVLEVHERVKIFTSEGFEYSDWTIYFEDARAIDARTYNLEDGEVIITEVENKNVYEHVVNKNEVEHKISFPNVREGSILEIRYKVPLIGLYSLFTQANLPIKQLRMEIKNPYETAMVIRDNPYVQLPIRRIDLDYGSLFLGTDVPPLRKEKFVGNINNHRGRIWIEFYVQYEKSWAYVAKMFNESETLGRQFSKPKSLYGKDLKELIAGDEDPLTIAKKVDRHLKEVMVWNQYYNKGSESIRKAYQEKVGTTGDINLLYVHALRSLGLAANPMLVSSKWNGWAFYPSLRSFNSVICALELNGETYLLDASQKNASFGQIPLEYVNGNGFIVYPDGASVNYPITLKESSKNIEMVNAVLNLEEGAIVGKVQQRITDYFALEYRERYENTIENKHETDLETINLLSIENLEKKDVADPEKPITISYDFKYADYLEQIGSDIYFEPLLYLGKKENEYNETGRLYPIDLEKPYLENFIINYEIPEGYRVESLPEAKNIAIQDNVASLKFDTMQRGNSVQVSLAIHVKEHLLPASHYEALKSLFIEYTNISKSKIVLTKI